MTEGAEKTVEELLAEAAVATEAHNPPKAKKERVKKEVSGEAKEPKAPKAPKEPKAPKQYPQANEDGTQKFAEDGTTPIMGPKETAFKAPKAPRESKSVSLIVGGKTVKLSEIQNDALITVVGAVGSREGSKRAERAKAFDGAATVQDFLVAGGATKDLLRHLKSGAVKLTVNGEDVQAAGASTAE